MINLNGFIIARLFPEGSYNNDGLPELIAGFEIYGRFRVMHHVGMLFFREVTN